MRKTHRGSPLTALLHPLGQITLPDPIFAVPPTQNTMSSTGKPRRWNIDRGSLNFPCTVHGGTVKTTEQPIAFLTSAPNTVGADARSNEMQSI
jgi:hypothetical protein